MSVPLEMTVVEIAAPGGPEQLKPKQRPVPRPGDSLRSKFSERNLLLYAGQLIRGKGVDVLLRALAKVRSPFEAVADR